MATMATATTAPSSLPYASDLTTMRPITGQDCGATRGGTLPRMLTEAVASRGDVPWYYTASDEPVTGAAFYALARRVARALIAAGVAPGCGAAILGFSSVEWFAADWGAVLAGVLPAPSYESNSAEVLAYILDHSRAGVCFVDTEEAMVKAIAAKAQTKVDGVRCIVVWEEEIDMAKYRDHAAYLLSWEEFLAGGEEVAEGLVDERMALARPEACAKLIYTSGTTGPPKGVMISHDNIDFVAQMTLRDFQIADTDTVVSYLPASHIAANVLDCMGPMATPVTVYLAGRDALKGSLVDRLKQVRPTCFYAVPRVWEKIHERMVGMRTGMNPIALFISNWAKWIGLQASVAEDAGRRMPFGTAIAERLVFSNVKKALGLDRARLVVNTAAPLQPSTNEYFRSLRLKIFDIYGMSESTGALTASKKDQYRAGSVGKPGLGMELKLHKKDEVTGEGELCFRGRNVFIGYLGNEEESKAALDSDGYLHTGDLATVDEDGFVFITGRAKEIIVTSGGENVAPSLIEAALKNAMPAISRAFAVGDTQKYVSCLLVPFIDDGGALSGPAAAVSDSAKTAADAATDEKWKEYVEKGIAEANKNAISNVATVKRFCILPEDFSVEPRTGMAKGELTPTMKVKRKVVVQNFAEIIQTMYGN